MSENEKVKIEYLENKITPCPNCKVNMTPLVDGNAAKGIKVRVGFLCPKCKKVFNNNLKEMKITYNRVVP